MLNPTRSLPLGEFIVLLAFMISIVAMATDVMLPALSMIGDDLRIGDPNDAQLVVTSLFLGFSVGQLVVGPLSDTYGRRPVIFAGYAVFIAGCLLSIVATDLTVMLVGRVLQGVGAAAPRVVCISLVRDGYAGREMARIMSVIMSVFILVPALAPSIGQGVITFLPWHYTFVVLLVMAVAAALWFGFRQPETLAPEKRRALTAESLIAGCIEVLSIRVVLGYTLSMGFIFGAFLSYLGAARQIFQDALNVGDLFALYFGVAALALGAASLLNSMLVMRWGMRLLTHSALVGLILLSGVFLALFHLLGGQPSIALFLTWQLSAFFCVGLLFGNLNALAMEPLGHIAGLGAALVGAISTLISLPFGWLIGQMYDGTVLPLVGGFCALGLAALIAAGWTERMKLFRAAAR